MRALVLNSYKDGKFVETQVPRPEAGPGQVLVRIAASGVNPIDSKIRTGEFPHAMPELPAILGTDLAGVVEAVGRGVKAFKVGDEVYGLAGGVRGVPGSLAQYAAVDADVLAIKPKNISMREAAAIPLVLLTAWEGLVDGARVSAGQKVLVLGGAGGVGHMAVQIARARGAEVFATEAPAKREIIESYGATWIDRSTDVDTYVNTYTGGQGFDAVFDTVGGKLLEQALVAAGMHGHVSSSLAFGPIDLAPGSLKGVTVTGVYVLLPLLTGKRRTHHGDILRQATALIEAEKIRVMVDPQRFDLSNAIGAHEALLGGNVVGKAVIDVA
ncbi:zinc-dependent alcohol dehydrogenase family protein [Dyella sp.]|uniref:zinc-dependent alcohol dehydrogenase family protein n=1 Tax=Dyella sp. TaxID=1869338 RepID=UPI0039C89F09